MIRKVGTIWCYFLMFVLKFAVISSISISSYGSDLEIDKNDTYLIKENNATLVEFANGADVSWLTQMESQGRKFYNSAGTQTECMALLKSLGINAIRLRVWVNPANGWCNAADMLVKAKRANDLGLRLMINFHYSDSWADPGKQTKPAAWTDLSFADLRIAVSNHTTEVLSLLKVNNITPEWVQIGNETGNGMLWRTTNKPEEPTGQASVSMANYAALSNAGYDAAKAVFPNAKVIVHVHNGYDNGLFRWLFDGLKNNGGKWDVIGMSLYPNWYTSPNDWSNANKACLANMNDMVNRYGKEVMIVECGMSWDNAVASYNFLKDLIEKTKSIPNRKGLGVFYWEPQCYGNWQGYTLGAFDNSGKPTVAMNAFNTSTQNVNVKSENITFTWNRKNGEMKFSHQVKDMSVFSIDGKLIYKGVNADIFRIPNLSTGNYILNYTENETGNSFNKQFFY